MQMSGINLDVYKAHGTRAASVSSAHRAHAPIQEILNKARRWSYQNFVIYYDKRFETSESSVCQFQEAVLTMECFFCETCNKRVEIYLLYSLVGIWHIFVFPHRISCHVTVS